MNYPIMVDNAFYCLRTQSLEQYKSQIVRLISDAYYSLDRYYTRLAYSSGKNFDNYAFANVRALVMLAMQGNNIISESKEYDVYRRFCDKANYDYLSYSELVRSVRDLTTGDYISATKSIVSARSAMESTNYQNLVYGLIMLAIFEEGRFTESMYGFFKIFFNSPEDNCPSSYQRLMSEVYG